MDILKLGFFNNLILGCNNKIDKFYSKIHHIVPFPINVETLKYGNVQTNRHFDKTYDSVSQTYGPHIYGRDTFCTETFLRTPVE